MDKNVMSQLDAELEHAGEETALSPKMLLLEQLRITPEKQLKPMEFLFHLYGKPCFPKRELVAITGKAKSGKTFVTSMLMACCQNRDVLAFQRIGDEPLRVLWYDTEQSDESTQDILKNRVMRMVDGDVQLFDIFNVRGVAWKERRDLLREAVTRCKPDLVIVDGIRDLVNDINDGVLAQEVMEELMHLATEHDCCIVCVLHQNKSGEDHNLRGWIGTELTNKAFEIYTCEKLPHRIFKFEQDNSRKYDWERELYFTVDDDGLPALSDEPEDKEVNRNDKKDKLPPLNREYIVTSDDDKKGWHFDVEKIIHDVMKGAERIQAKTLREGIMKLTHIENPYTYNDILREAIGNKLIVQKQEKRLTFYEAAPF